MIEHDYNENDQSVTHECLRWQGSSYIPYGTYAESLTLLSKEKLKFAPQ